MHKVKVEVLNEVIDIQAFLVAVDDLLPVATSLPVPTQCLGGLQELAAQPLPG